MTTPTPGRNDAPYDPRLEAIWRAASQEEPPTELDTAILAAARREVGAGPQSTSTQKTTVGSRQWWPLAAAATVAAIAVGVLQLTPPDQLNGPAPEKAVITDMPAPDNKLEAEAKVASRERKQTNGAAVDPMSQPTVDQMSQRIEATKKGAAVDGTPQLAKKDGATDVRIAESGTMGGATDDRITKHGTMGGVTGDPIPERDEATKRGTAVDRMTQRNEATKDVVTGNRVPARQDAAKEMAAAETTAQRLDASSVPSLASAAPAPAAVKPEAVERKAAAFPEPFPAASPAPGRTSSAPAGVAVAPALAGKIAAPPPPNEAPRVPAVAERASAGRMTMKGEGGGSAIVLIEPGQPGGPAAAAQGVPPGTAAGQGVPQGPAARASAQVTMAKAPTSENLADAARTNDRAPLPIAEWVALIRRLRDAGKTAEAAKELAAFRAAHSDHERLLPRDLVDWRPASK